MSRCKKEGKNLIVIVKDKKGNVITRMEGPKFIAAVKSEFGISKNSFVSDAIKIYNKNYPDNNAEQILESLSEADQYGIVLDILSNDEVSSDSEIVVN